jgi:hypothetical protein
LTGQWEDQFSAVAHPKAPGTPSLWPIDGAKAGVCDAALGCLEAQIKQIRPERLTVSDRQRRNTRFHFKFRRPRWPWRERSGGIGWQKERQQPISERLPKTDARGGTESRLACGVVDGVLQRMARHDQSRKLQSDEDHWKDDEHGSEHELDECGAAHPTHIQSSAADDSETRRHPCRELPGRASRRLRPDAPWRYRAMDDEDATFLVGEHHIERPREAAGVYRAATR